MYSRSALVYVFQSTLNGIPLSFKDKPSQTYTNGGKLQEWPFFNFFFSRIGVRTSYVLSYSLNFFTTKTFCVYVDLFELWNQSILADSKSRYNAYIDSNRHDGRNY